MRRPECERAAAMIKSAACSASRRLVRLGQNRMAEAGLAVNLARVPYRNGDRCRRARPDRDIRPPGKRHNRARVARRGRKGDVADHSGDAEDLRLVMRAGVEERERIVDAGVDVDDQRLGMLGHGVNLSSVSSVRTDPSMRRDIVAGRGTQGQTAKPRRSFPTQRNNRRTATTASPIASPIHTPTGPSGVANPKATPIGAPIAQ